MDCLLNCLIRLHTQEQDLTFADTVARSIRKGHGTCSPNGNATRAGNPAGPRSGPSSLASACVSPLSRSREVTADLIVPGTAVFCNAQGACSQVSGGCCRNRYSCTFHLLAPSGSCPRTKAARQRVEQIEQTLVQKLRPRGDWRGQCGALRRHDRSGIWSIRPHPGNRARTLPWGHLKPE